MMTAFFALAGLQLVGGFQQADIIRKNGALQQRIAQMNAEFADYDAEQALQAGYTEAAQYKNVVDSTIATQRSAQATNGVQLGYGSEASVEAESKIAGMVNTLQIQRHARETAMGYETQKININLGGAMKELQAGLDAGSAQFKGITGAAQTTLSGYEFSHSTGTGNTSRTGSSDKPTWRQSANIDGSQNGMALAGGSDFASEVG